MQWIWSTDKAHLLLVNIWQQQIESQTARSFFNQAGHGHRCAYHHYYQLLQIVEESVSNLDISRQNRAEVVTFKLEIWQISPLFSFAWRTANIAMHAYFPIPRIIAQRRCKNRISLSASGWRNYRIGQRNVEAILQYFITLTSAIKNVAQTPCHIRFSVSNS